MSQTITADVVGLCETFLHDVITDSSLFINNFNFERQYRLTQKDGGVLVYIRKSIPFIRRHDLESDTVMSLCIELPLYTDHPTQKWFGFTTLNAYWTPSITLI